MSEPVLFTAQQAADPSTPGEVLASIAAERPDLRPYVAANPAAYPGLLDWLGALGDPAVDAALRARSGPEAPTAVIPQAPVALTPETPAAYTPPAYEAPAAYAPDATYPAPGDQPTAYQPTAYQAPAPGYGQAPVYGAAPGGMYGAPGAPYSGAPGAPYGGPPRKSRAWIWIVAAVVALAVLGTIIFFVFRAVNQARETIDDVVTNQGANTYGDDPALDALWDACEAGEMQACDDLFRDSPVGSEYEDFGNTCGGRTSGGTWCVDEGAATPGATATATGAFAYGDDPALDALWDACAAGTMQACDDLYRQAPVGSEYETFGDTCGQTTDGSTWCADGGTTGSTSANAYGDDAYFDGLWDSCAAGDMAACDTLYRESPVGSEYETFGDTCGGRTSGGTWCEQ